MSILRLLWVYCRLGILGELEYRSNFFIQLVQSIVRLGSSLIGLDIVMSHTKRLGGWSGAELLAVLGIFYLVGGVIGLIIQPSMQRFMEDVRLGTLDFTLTKPEDAQLLVSVCQVQVWKLVDVSLGVVVLILAMIHVRSEIGLASSAQFMVSLLAGVTIVYCFWLILATCTFWFVRIVNILVIFQSMYEAGRWPVGIYPGWLRGTLTFVVPIAFAITVPAEALTGRLTVSILLEAVALAGAMVAISRTFWKIGVRHYSGASS